MGIRLSILIGTYNRCESLKKALLSIKKAADRVNFVYEIIVIDNNSPDNTKGVVESLISEFNGHLRYVFEPNQGLNFARNRGIEESNGEIVVYTDDDVIVSEDWMIEIDKFFNDFPDADSFGGRVLPDYPDGSPAWVKEHIDLLKGAILIHDYDDATIVYDRSIMPQFVGANMGFRREVFADTAGFRIDVGVGTGTMGAETEFFDRLMQHNKKVYYCGKILLWHPVEPRRMTFKFLAEWNFKLGRYRFKVDEKGEIDSTLIYYFGIPRYLIKSILVTALSLPLKAFNRREFLKTWIRLSQQWGRMEEIRKRYYQKCHPEERSDEGSR